MGKLAITGATGKLGGAVLKALIEHEMIDPKEIVISTSSSLDHPKFYDFAMSAKGLNTRKASYTEPEALETAFKGCDKLFLVSTPEIQLDCPDAAFGEGREGHHINAINAARKAGVKHVYYTSLAFAAQDGKPGSTSKAAVMRAHLRTEEYLRKVKADSNGEFEFTIIREGLYAESWPLYFGYYDVGRDLREEIYIAGDGPICWTTIPDLAYATARIITAPSAEYAGKLFYLSNTGNPMTLAELADFVGKKESKSLRTATVSIDEFEDFYFKHGKEGVRGEEWLVKWWSSTYAALADGECLVKDTTLAEILKKYGREIESLK